MGAKRESMYFQLDFGEMVRLPKMKMRDEREGAFQEGTR